MKKVLTIISLICVCILMGCQSQEQTESIKRQYDFHANVLEIKDDYIKGECIKSVDSGIQVGEEVVFPINTVSQNENLEINVGDDVRVIFNGNRHETNPIEIDTVFHIYLIDENGEVIDNEVKEFKGE